MICLLIVFNGRLSGGDVVLGQGMLQFSLPTLARAYSGIKFKMTYKSNTAKKKSLFLIVKNSVISIRTFP